MNRLALAAVVVMGVMAVGAAIATRGGDVAGDRQPERRASSLQSPGGPVEVAAGFLRSLTLAALLDMDRRNAFLARWVAPSARARLGRIYAGEADRVASAYASRPRVSRGAFLGYRLENLGAVRARVTLWAVSLGGAGSAPVAVGWRTIEVELVVVDGAWRIADVQEKPGPSPTMTVSQLQAASASFRGLRVAP